MKIEVRREACTESSTPGKMYVDGKFYAYTIEDVEREGVAVDKNKKVYGRTAIPRGSYKCIVTYSPHFKREVTLVLDVPNFRGIRIHSGNTASDSEGCIIIAKHRFSTEKVWGASRKLERKLTALVKEAGEATLEVASVEEGKLLVFEEMEVKTSINTQKGEKNA